MATATALSPEYEAALRLMVRTDPAGWAEALGVGEWFRGTASAARVGLGAPTVGSALVPSRRSAVPGGLRGAARIGTGMPQGNASGTITPVQGRGLRAAAEAQRPEDGTARTVACQAGDYRERPATDFQGRRPAGTEPVLSSAAERSSESARDLAFDKRTRDGSVQGGSAVGLSARSPLARRSTSAGPGTTHTDGRAGARSAADGELPETDASPATAPRLRTRQAANPAPSFSTSRLQDPAVCKTRRVS